MYRVLLPTDSNEKRCERSVRAITDLPIDPGDIEVIILNVFEEFDVTGEGAQVSSDEFFDDREFPDSVEVVTERLEAAGIRFKKRREHGDPADQILAVADDIDADSIAMSGRKRSPAGKAVFGSVLQSILLSANRPVIAILDE